MRMNGETTLSTIPRPERVVQPSRKIDSTQVDWEEIRRKVLESSARLVWMDDVPQDVLEQAWAQRAEQVAQVIADGESGEQIEIVVIRLGREVYGVETDYVFDIRSLEHITRVPRVPDWVAGVVNLRGRIISALDLQRYLGLPPAENGGEVESGARHLVVVGTPAMELALLVDEVLAVESLPISQIQEATSAVKGIQAEYMRGIVVQSQAGDDTAPLLVLDLPALLADKRLIVHEDII